MQKCPKCTKEFEVRGEDLEFYKKFEVPGPSLCPDCRLQKRLNFRNERTLYKRKSDFSDKPVISIYHPESKYTVYSPDEWWGDKWDGLNFGQDFDFSRPFFEQFHELALKVPRIALFNINPVNSDYCQQAYDNKNSYLCMVVEECEDCMYISHSNKMTVCFDCNYLQQSELCYECTDSEKLYACVGCQSCKNSNSLVFCADCIGCHDCVGCFGLRNKEYYIMNEKHSKEEYEEKVKMLELNKYSKFANARNYFLGWTKDLPHRASRNINVEDCVGDYLINAQRANECFDSYEIQDCSYCTWIFNSHDIFDVYGMGYSEWCLECLGVEKLNNCAFNTFVSHSSDVFYSDLCFNSMYLFGCVGLRNKKYCIFNKEYSSEEYADLKGRIIEHMKKSPHTEGQAGEWGEFFPTTLSPFAYNETAAMNSFPLEKDEILKQGFSWKEESEKNSVPSSYQIPDDVNDVDESLCNELLACTSCSKNYRILPNELIFYKNQGLPIPRKCPGCRYKDRLELRNPRKLYRGKCANCHADFNTSYAPDRAEKIYCEKCYAEEMK